MTQKVKISNGVKTIDSIATGYFVLTCGGGESIIAQCVVDCFELRADAYD